MDTEKYNEMQEKVAAGKPVTDEGPYFHHVQWEAYKGLSKGMLGGAFIGTLVGGLVGGAAALALLPVIGTTAAVVSAVAFTGVGLWKGMDKFGSIGTVSAAVAAGLDTAERRGQIYLDNKVNEIKADLGNPEAKEALKNAKEPAYRTTHYVPPQDESVQQPTVFWKVALVGLAVGVAAGLLFAMGGLAGGVIEHVVGHAIIDQLGPLGIATVSAATFGAFGASFGINRDVFRKIFDATDMMYRGRAGDPVHAKMVTRSKEKAQEIEKPQEAEQPAPQTVLFDGHMTYPPSETYHRDKYAAAKQVLQEMDHTKMSPH